MNANAISMVSLLMMACLCQAQEQPEESRIDETLIRRLNQEFVDAFNNADAKAIGALWSEQGELTVDGDADATGRGSIVKLYDSFFADNKGVKISLNVTSWRQPGPNLLIEKGVTEVAGDDESELVDLYTLIRTRVKGKWLIASCQVEQTPVDPVDWKDGLAFLIGKWSTGGDKWKVNSEFTLLPGSKYIKRVFSVSNGEETTVSGTQVIGFDPAASLIRSWTFTADGGHSSETWRRDGEQWEIQSVGYTADGVNIASTNVLTPIDAKAFRWQSTNRIIGGTALPETDPVVVRRVVNQEKTDE